MTTETSPSPDTAGWRVWLWPALAVVLVAAAAAFGVLWWTARSPGEGDPAVTFARDMIAHHQQAVEMALIMRERTEDAELRQVALDMVLTQQNQMGQMQGWLEVWRLSFSGAQPPLSDHASHGADMPPNMGMASAAEVEALRTLPVAEAEVKFLQLMIRHHQGGVYMANFALEQTARPEAVRLAEAIILSQTTEIGYMQQLLQARGVAP